MLILDHCSIITVSKYEGKIITAEYQFDGFALLTLYGFLSNIETVISP